MPPRRASRSALASSVSRARVPSSTRCARTPPASRARSRHLGVAIAGHVHGRDAIGLAVGREQAAPVGRHPVQRRRRGHGRLAAGHADRRVQLRAAGRRLAGDDVDDPADRARTEQGRAAALGHLDAIDQPRRNLLEPVDLRQRGQGRLSIHQDLGVRPLEAKQADLREIAVLAVVLDAHAGRVLDGVGQRSSADLLDEVARDDLGAHRRVAKPGVSPLGRHLDVGLERRREDDRDHARPWARTSADTKPGISTRTVRAGARTHCHRRSVTPTTGAVWHRPAWRPAAARLMRPAPRPAWGRSAGGSRLGGRASRTSRGAEVIIRILTQSKNEPITLQSQGAVVTRHRARMGSIRPHSAFLTTSRLGHAGRHHCHERATHPTARTGRLRRRRHGRHRLGRTSRRRSKTPRTGSCCRTCGSWPASPSCTGPIRAGGAGGIARPGGRSNRPGADRNRCARPSRSACCRRHRPSRSTSWGHLELIEQIGQGSFGNVYRARDTRLDRDVALKLLRKGRQTAELAEKILHEGRILARVRHRNVVTVFGVEEQDGRIGLWMEYIRGRTLEQLLRSTGLVRGTRSGADRAGAVPRAGGGAQGRPGASRHQGAERDARRRRPPGADGLRRRPVRARRAARRRPAGSPARRCIWRRN